MPVRFGFDLILIVSLSLLFLDSRSAEAQTKTYVSMPIIAPEKCIQFDTVDSIIQRDHAAHPERTDYEYQTYRLDYIFGDYGAGIEIRYKTATQPSPSIWINIGEIYECTVYVDISIDDAPLIQQDGSPVPKAADGLYNLSSGQLVRAQLRVKATTLPLP